MYLILHGILFWVQRPEIILVLCGLYTKHRALKIMINRKKEYILRKSLQDGYSFLVEIHDYL